MEGEESGSGGVPLFIVGCGRSGTTMLRLMLDSHPDLAIPGESHFIPELYRRRKKYLRTDGSVDARSLASEIMRTLHFGRWQLPEEPVWRRVEGLESLSFSEVISAVYRAYADHQGKLRWGDKTPIYVRSVPLMADLFPNSRFIHIIRDGRNVALSYLSLPWGPRTIWEAARKWRIDVSAGRAAGEVLERHRYLEVRYEDLIVRPRVELQRVCDFGELTFNERMLEYYSDARPRLQAGPQETRFHGSVTKPPTAGLRDWRAQMSEPQILAFEAVAGPLLADLSYPRYFERVPLAWRAKAVLWLRALDLLVAGSTFKRRSRNLLSISRARRVDQTAATMRESS